MGKRRVPSLPARFPLPLSLCSAMSTQDFVHALSRPAFASSPESQPSYDAAMLVFSSSDGAFEVLRRIQFSYGSGGSESNSDRALSPRSIVALKSGNSEMKLVEFSFTKLFSEEAPTYIRMVDEGIHEYVALPLPPTPAYGEDANPGNLKADGNQSGSLVSSNGLSDFDMYIMETTSQQMKSELDQYLDESLLPRVQEIDVLGWWKMNRIKYPTFSKMARDVLSIPLSSVGPDYVFDTVGREMDQYRSSLRPETMETLMCAKDWPAAVSAA